MRGKKLILFLICLSFILTSGCWDKVELNDRAFINGMAIDVTKDYKDNQDKNQGNNKIDPFCENKPNRFKVNFGIINPSKLQGGENALELEAVEAVDIPDAMEKAGQSTSRKPFYGQMIILEFGEDLLKDGKLVREVLDEFERKAVVNRNMKVVCISGDMDEFIKIKPKLESFIGASVEGILNNAAVLSNTVDMNLNEVLSASRDGDGTFVIPLARAEDAEKSMVTVDRLALMKDYKLFKILDTKYVKTYKILNNKLKNGRKLVSYKDHIIPFYIFSSERKIWLEADGDNLTYKIKVTMEGDIEQYHRDEKIFDPKTIKEIKKATEDSLKAEIEESIKYFQNELETDYLGINDYTNKYHNKIYKKYKDNWNEAFKKAKFDIEVEADIRRVGTVKE